MKETVTDISKVMQGMAAEMQSMRETINRLYADVARLHRNAESLNIQICKKDKENAELKERLSKYESPRKDSGNSGTPPSKESMKAEIVRRTKTLRAPPAARSPAGRRGMKGTDSPCRPLRTKWRRTRRGTAGTAANRWRARSACWIT